MAAVQKVENFQLLFHHRLQHDHRRGADGKPHKIHKPQLRAKLQNCKIDFVRDKVARVLIKADEGIGEGEEIFINYGQNYFQGMKCLCDQDGCFENRKKF